LGRVRRLPLRGADLVLLAMHARWARAGASSNTMMVVECDGPVDAGRFRRALDRLLDVCPWPAARLRRRLPWGPLHWAAPPRSRLAPPPVLERRPADGDAVHRVLEAELNDAIDGRREAPLRLVVAGRVLVVTWFHPLMDPRGGQNLLAHLARIDAATPDSPWREPPEAFVAPRDGRPLRERGRLARRSLAHMRRLAGATVVSPGTGVAAFGAARFLQQGFDVPATPGGDARATREISWRLAVVGRAMADLWRRRSLPGEPFLLPISVDLRPRGEPGPTIGNMLAFHFARFSPAETDDVPALARALRQRMADAVRDGLVDANAVAMDFLRYRPVRLMMTAVPWAAGGETFSFNCADISDFPPDLDRLLGRRVLNAYHVPAVLPRPGIGVFFNRCGGRSNVVVSWVEGAVNDDEAQRVMAMVAGGLGWTAAS